MKNQIAFSAVIAGCMKWGKWGSCFSTSSYLSAIELCVENNINSFDHADIYGDYTTEKEFGTALKNNSALRTKIQLITKCGIKIQSANRPINQIKSYDTSSTHIIQSVEKSLENLHTDYIDVFLLHRPNPLMDPIEIAEAFSKLKQQGKVLHFGVSNFTASQVDLINQYYPVEVNQIEISISHLAAFQNGQLDQCIQKQIIPMAWSPLGGGSLFSEVKDERSIRILNAAKILDKKYDAGIDNILLAFLTAHPAGIIPVLGTSKIERLRSAIVNSSLQLEREEWFMLWTASTGQDVP
jgi:predicted oxidoreductase